MRKARFNVLDYENKDFYQVERDENGKNWIHDNGYFYYSGSLTEDDDEEYRVVEFTNLYLDPVKLRREGFDYYEATVDFNDQYIGEYTLEEVEEYYINSYFTGRNKAKYLPMNEVTDATPEGWYYAKVN